MYELICAKGGSHYIDCPAKMGLVELGDGAVCLIDGGSGKDAAKKALRHIDDHGWLLTGVFCTHSHADHIGGCQTLQNRTDCRVYAPGMECDFTNHPLLEPSFLYGGNPCQELRNKFLLAPESRALPLENAVLPEGLEVIPLPGHSFHQVGYRTKDGVAYLADCLSSRETLDKYKIGFLWDVAAYLDTLEQVKAMDAALFVPAHAEAAEDIAPLAQYNIDMTHAIAEKILTLCAEPRHFEQLLKALFDEYGLVLNFQQYVLAGSTVRSYLTWLKETGRITAGFENNLLLWRKA